MSAALLLVAGLLPVVVPSAAAQMSVRINEVVSINDGGLVDAYGSTSDWIELYNPGPNAIDLSGWALSDDATRPFRWLFPDGTVVASDAYLIVFASGEPSTAGELHAGFTVSGNGETVTLRQEDGAIASEMVVPALLVDRSFGVAAGGSTSIFSTPTPGSENGAGSAVGILADVAANPGRGFFDNPVQVTLSHPDPAVEIRFTTNRSAPTAVTGTVYTGPITVSSTTVLRIAAFRNGWITDRPSTHTYVFTDTVASQASMHAVRVDQQIERDLVRRGVLALPAVSIVTAGINQVNAVATTVEWIDPDGGPEFQVDAAVKHVGGSSVNFAKGSWRLSFGSEWGESSLEFPVFDDFPSDGTIAPVREFKRLTLRSGSHDTLFYGPASHFNRQTWIKSRWSDETMLELGHVNSHGRWVNLFINGQFWGQYQAREHFDDHFMASYYGGDNSEYLGLNRGAVTVGSGDGWAAATAAATTWATFSQHVDPVAYVDWMILNEYSGNYWDLRNTHNWRGAGQSSAGDGPGFIWQNSDPDITLNYPNRALAHFTGPAGSWGALRVEKDPNFVALVTDRAHHLLRGQGELTPNAAVERWNRLRAEIEESVHAEIARWGAYGTSSSYTTFVRDHNYVANTVLPARTAYTLNRLTSYGILSPVQAPSIATPQVMLGQPVIIEHPNAGGLVFFTVDGSDPRSTNGGASEGAIVGNQVVVDRPMTVRYRVQHNGEWSPIVETDVWPLTDAEAPSIDVPDDLSSVQGFGSRIELGAESMSGGDVVWSVDGLPAGLALDQGTGVISGVATEVGTHQIVVHAADGQHEAVETFVWIVEAAAALTPPPLVLSEYNAVNSSDFLGDDGYDTRLGRIEGNGGDWFELLVTSEGLDLRGWQVELFDRENGQLEQTDTMTFSQHPLLADLRAGTILTIAEAQLEDPSYNPIERDYTIEIRSTADFASAFVSGLGSFDTNRHGFRVRVRDDAGQIRSPYQGETEAWRTTGNVGGEEVFARCDGPEQGQDPVDGDHRDVTTSTYGAANRCDDTDQDLSSLQAGFRGDPSCDGRSTIADALFIARFEVAIIGSKPRCGSGAATDISLESADFNGDGTINIADALVIARCSVGIPAAPCLAEN